MTRYARQTALPQVGAAGQARLRGAHVLVVGAGGLGAPVLTYLAGAGLGRITIVDGDTVEESNLHRQPIYGMADLGAPKARAAARALARLNPEVAVEARAEWLDPASAPGLVAGADVVLDCADTFAASFTLSDACMAAGRPLISASVLGFQGYAGGFCGGAPSLRAVFPDLPQAAPTCATAGVMGPVVGVIGALQAQMALAVLLGHAPSPLGRMMLFDARTWRMSGFSFAGTREPAVAWPFLAPAQIAPGDVVIDLRTEAPGPFRADALHLPPEALAGFTPPEGASRVVLACRTGLRAFAGAETLSRRWRGPIALMSLPPSPSEKDP
jgi:sulfur-carrier protein adenylyltransferase/sulfurtransferase